MMVRRQQQFLVCCVYKNSLQILHQMVRYFGPVESAHDGGFHRRLIAETIRSVLYGYPVKGNDVDGGDDKSSLFFDPMRLHVLESAVFDRNLDCEFSPEMIFRLARRLVDVMDAEGLLKDQYLNKSDPMLDVCVAWLQACVLCKLRGDSSLQESEFQSSCEDWTGLDRHDIKYLINIVEGYINRGEIELPTWRATL